MAHSDSQEGFEPSDYELIRNFLMKQVIDEPMPNQNIHNVVFYNHQPSHLAKTFECANPKKHEWYFFVKSTRKLCKGVGAIRKAKNGYWKVIEKDTAITVGNEVIGYKKPLVFFKGKKSKESESEWAMFEYRLHHNIQPRPKNLDNFRKKWDEWVLCKIYPCTVKRHTSREKRKLNPRGVANTDDLWNGNYGVMRSGRYDMTKIGYKYNYRYNQRCD